MCNNHCFLYAASLLIIVCKVVHDKFAEAFVARDIYNMREEIIY